MKLNDLQRFAEELTTFYCKKYNLDPIKIKVKDIDRGHARYRTRFLSVPLWSFEQGGLDKFTAYVLHEITHFILYETQRDHNHPTKFHNIEIKLLKEWGLVPKEYRKAYYSRLETTSGKLIWLYTKERRTAAGIKRHIIF